MLTEKPKEMKPGLWDKIMGTYLHNVQQSFLNNNNEMCWISVCFYTNTMRINMQTVTYFWNNTTNQVAFGDQLQDQRWNWDIGKIIANFNFTLEKIPLISNSFKVILFQEKEEFQTLWPILLISIHALWMIFIYSSEVHAEKVWRQHIELSFSIK